jgi:hypothetical protein
MQLALFDDVLKFKPISIEHPNSFAGHLHFSYWAINFYDSVVAFEKGHIFLKEAPQTGKIVD